MQLLLGIDVGTSGCKVTAVSPQGAVVASGAQPYPTRYPKPGWAEQDPEDWYRAACQAVRACLETGGLKPGKIVGLSVDGPAHNVALLNQKGEVVYPTIHWSDLRSTPQAEWLQARYGDRIFEISFQPVNPSWTLTQLLWLRENEPGVWEQVRRILVTKDYVRYRLTGAYQTDMYDAIGTQLYDVAAGDWSAELCDLLGWPADWMPRVLPAQAVAGELLRGPARDTGLRPGTPVAVGSGDSVVEAFGVGVIEPGQGIIKLGTAANVSLVCARSCPSPQSLTYRHVIEDRWFSITATNSGASTMRWFWDTFCQHEAARAKEKGASVYELIGQLSAEAPPGCEGLLFHPYLLGERSPYWDPRLRGDFVGISARHRLPHFARAILEGVAFSIRDCRRVIESLGQPVCEWRLLGGGTKSPLWRQILCDVIGQPLLKPGIDDASFGAALLAGVALGVFRDWHSAVAACVNITETVQPNPDTRALYNDYFEVYRDITRDLAAHSHRLADLAAGQPS